MVSVERLRQENKVYFPSKVPYDSLVLKMISVQSPVFMTQENQERVGPLFKAARRRKIKTQTRAEASSWHTCMGHNWLWQVFILEVSNGSEALTTRKSWVLKYKH